MARPSTRNRSSRPATNLTRSGLCGTGSESPAASPPSTRSPSPSRVPSPCSCVTFTRAVGVATDQQARCSPAFQRPPRQSRSRECPRRSGSLRRRRRRTPSEFGVVDRRPHMAVRSGPRGDARRHSGGPRPEHQHPNSLEKSRVGTVLYSGFHPRPPTYSQSTHSMASSAISTSQPKPSLWIATPEATRGAGTAVHVQVLQTRGAESAGATGGTLAVPS